MDREETVVVEKADGNEDVEDKDCRLRGGAKATGGRKRRWRLKSRRRRKRWRRSRTKRLCTREVGVKDEEEEAMLQQRDCFATAAASIQSLLLERPCGGLARVGESRRGVEGYFPYVLRGV